MSNRYIHIILTFLSLSLAAQKNVVITPLSEVNTSYNEFAPFVFQNKLVYVTDQKKEGLITYTTEKGKTLTDYKYVLNVGGKKWIEPADFAPEITTPHFEGPFTFDIENDRFYFTQNLLAEDTKTNSLKDGNSLTILSSLYVNGEFRTPMPVSALRSANKSYNYICPTVNADGTMLFFSSDMTGGQGKYDLYVCEGKNGRFGKPVNLGAKVNTNGDEIYPFAHISGRLYFSSKNHGGEGRFDVFYTYLYEGEWQTPINAGYPFNSKFDDYGVYINDDLKTGFFSRKKGDFNIFHYEIKYPIFKECKEMVENTFKYRFFDQNCAKLDTTAFLYEWDLGDGTKVRREDVIHTFAEPGMYFVQLNVIDALTGEVFANQANYMLDLKYIEQVYINSVDTVYVNEEIVFDGLETNLSNFEINEYYWFFDDETDVKQGLSVGKKYEKEGNYTVKLGITSVMDEKTQIKKACGSKRIVVIKR